MYMGIDLGTSGVKTVLMDENQNIIGEADSALSVSRPQKGFSEQDPKDWAAAVDETITILKQQMPQEIAKLKAISFSGQMHGLTLLDEQGSVIRPAILWNDGRSGLECTELKQKEPQFLSLGGNDVMAGFTAPKLEWVRKNEPKNFAKTHMILLPKDYIRYILSGDYVSEMSDAAGTLWLDVQKRDWAEPLLKASQITRAQLPRLVEGTDVSGMLKKDLAEKWGIRNAVKIVGGAGDNAAAACGLGAVEPNDAFLSLGTSGVVFVSMAGFSAAPLKAVHAFCHALPRTWHQMAVILAATDCVNWLAQMAGQDVKNLMEGLGSIEDGPSDIIFLPYLSGERTPLNDPSARGAYVNLARSHSTKDIARATIEGVAYALNDGLSLLQETGNNIQNLMVVGGGSQNKLWLEILASLTGCSLHIPHAAHLGAAFGAARLAMAGANPQLSYTDIFTKPPIREVIKPNAKVTEAYQQKFQQFKKLYPALKEIL